MTLHIVVLILHAASNLSEYPSVCVTQYISSIHRSRFVILYTIHFLTAHFGSSYVISGEIGKNVFVTPPCTPLGRPPVIVNLVSTNIRHVV